MKIHTPRCAECADGVYAARGLEFLLDSEDTVHHYEAKGKQEQGMLKCSHFRILCDFSLIHEMLSPYLT